MSLGITSNFEDGVNKKLIEFGIYDMGAYGWMDADTQDPEFLGHALWQTEPPLEPEWEQLFGNGPVKHRPTDMEKFIMTSGSDFEGLMKFAQLSIGQALLFRDNAIDKPFDDNNFFWMNYVNAILYLNMASDRIRDFFIAYQFKVNTNVFSESNKKGNYYSKPFTMATKASSNSKTKELTSKSLQCSNEIYHFRKKRNCIVHDVSTNVGRQTNRLTISQQKQYDEDSKGWKSNSFPEFEELVQNKDNIHLHHHREQEASLDEVKSWYVLLIRTSNYVFELEHYLRNPHRYTASN